jgi:hypothetical protein
VPKREKSKSKHELYSFHARSPVYQTM